MQTRGVRLTFLLPLALLLNFFISPHAQATVDDGLQPPPVDKVYVIKNRHTEKCLAAKGRATGNGTSIVQVTCNSKDLNQQWRLLGSGGIQNLHSKKCIAPKGGKTSNGTVLRLWTCDAIKWSHQKWTVQAFRDGSLTLGRLVNGKSKTCVTPQGGAGTSGKKDNVQQRLWSCGTAKPHSRHQEWSLTPVCPAGQITSGFICVLCPKGAARTSDEASCRNCGDQLASDDHSQCLPCPKGYSCFSGVGKPCILGTYSKNSRCVACPDGQETSPDKTSCVACSTGKIRRVPSPRCTYCPRGQHTNGTKTRCFGCRAGHACSLGVMVKCPAGKRVSSDRARCEVCPGGKVLNPKNNQCESCPAGQAPTASGTSCQKCPRGQIRSTNGATCTVCPKGKIASSDQTQCVACPAFHFCDKGMHGLCPPGYQASSNQTQCERCPAGTYRKGGAQQCTHCPPGQYVFENECMTCRVGETCVNGIRKPCPAGTQGSPDHSKCVACPAGYASSAGGMCTMCGFGKYASADKRSCLPCPKDSTCKNGLANKCPAGQIKKSGSNQCTPCPAGQVPSVRMDSCQACPSGAICQNGIARCPNGSYGMTCSTFGANTVCQKCYRCQAGFYSVGGQQCRVCLDGTYSSEGASSCSKSACPAGYNCTNGNIFKHSYRCYKGTVAFKNSKTANMSSSFIKTGSSCAWHCGRVGFTEAIMTKKKDFYGKLTTQCICGYNKTTHSMYMFATPVSQSQCPDGVGTNGTHALFHITFKNKYPNTILR